MNNKGLLLVVGFVVLVGGVWWWSSGVSSSTSSDSVMAPNSIEQKTMSTDTTGQAEVTGTSAKTATVSAIKEFTVEGSNFSFSPATITVAKGDTVKLTFKNASGFHDLKIDEFNVATKRSSGPSSETIEFVADKAGSFEYYCSVGSHRAMGMKGVLMVK